VQGCGHAGSSFANVVRCKACRISGDGG
jgi:hypothetical protein